jgi:hypothetical protein
MRFKTFLTEAVSDESKLTHLEHAEDHPINAGSAGFQHAFDTLHETHQLLTGKQSKATVTTKLDGSPSVVFGTNPENGKFFVSSKSAFNATPKLNYTPEDIEKNHGHAPGLVSKLKAALQHLPKVAPKEGVYQGEFMFNKDDGDVREEGNKFHFTPNTITYSKEKNSDEGKKIAAARMGVAVHTAYHGNSLPEMKAEYNPKLENFGSHSDVHIISPHAETEKIDYPESAQNEFKKHMQDALGHHGNLKDYDFADHEGRNDGSADHLKSLINKHVREGTEPTVDSYKEHIKNYWEKKAAGVKTDAAKQSKLKNIAAAHTHIDKHRDKFETMLNAHTSLQKAKNVLVNALSSHTTYGHHVGGKKVKPEGYVSVINNRPTKLVDRDEFSRLNFAARPR